MSRENMSKEKEIDVENKKDKVEFKGSFGRVYITNNGQYAEKYIDRYSTFRKNSLIESTTTREIALLLSIDHPNIISIIDSISANETEYSFKCDNKGLSLQDWLNDNNFTFEERINKLPSIVYQVLQALKYLDDNELIHGDLKPENILIDKDEKITLIDFGACVVDNTIVHIIEDQATFNMCTYSFSSPELLSLDYKSNKVNGKHDIFSLGLVIKYILLNSYNLEDDDIIIDCEKKNKEFELPDQLKEDLKAYIDITDLLSKMFVTDRDKRSSANELLTHNLFKSFNYPLVSKVNEVKFNDTIINNVKTNNKRSSSLKWLYKFCTTYKCQHIFVLTVWIYDKAIQIIKETEDDNTDDEKEIIDYRLIIASSLMIVDSLIEFGSISFELMIDQINRLYTSLIKKMVGLIFEKLNYNVYRRTFDYYLRKSNVAIDYEEIYNICLDGNNMSKSTEYLVKLYTTLTIKDGLSDLTKKINDIEIKNDIPS